MGYKYSIWLIPNNWKYIQSYYKTEHIPHITIKTLLSQNEAFKEFDMLKSHYMIKYQNNVHDFDEIKYKRKNNDDDDELEACGFFCKIQGLELEHKPHMTLYYHYHNSVLQMKAPTETLGKVCLVNTISDDPKKWYII